jgi:hypothetical protein
MDNSGQSVHPEKSFKAVGLVVSKFVFTARGSDGPRIVGILRSSTRPNNFCFLSMPKLVIAFEIPRHQRTCLQGQNDLVRSSEL